MNRISAQSRASAAVRRSGTRTDKPAGLDYVTEAPARRASRPVPDPRPVAVGFLSDRWLSRGQA
jgi:hypothetical protein